MRVVFADLMLSNSGDVSAARQGFIQPDQIRSTQAIAQVHTDMFTVFLPESVANQIGLPFVEYREFKDSDGAKLTLPVVGPVTLKFENRQTVCLAVRTQEEIVRLGAIAIGDMDVVTDQGAGVLTVNPKTPNMPRMRLK